MLSENVTDILVKLVEASDKLKNLFVTNESYLKALWNLIGLFRFEDASLTRIFKILNMILESNKNLNFSYRILKHIRSTIRECEKDLDGSKQLEFIYSLYETFHSRKKTEYSNDDSDEDSKNEEEKEKLRRVIEYVSCSSEKLNLVNLEDLKDENNNHEYTFMDDGNDQYSSDEEVKENFYQELLSLFLNMPKSIPRSETTVVNEWQENK